MQPAGVLANPEQHSAELMGTTEQCLRAPAVEDDENEKH